MLKGLFGKPKDESDVSIDGSAATPKRSDDKKMPKKSMSSRLFGSSVKNDIAAPVDNIAKQQLPAKADNQMAPSSPPVAPHSNDEYSPPTTNKMDAPARDRDMMDNRSASSLQNDDEHKAGLDDGASEVGGAFNSRLSSMLNPAHRMVMPPPDAATSLRKANISIGWSL
jgi:hypothetical protein